MVHLKFTFKFPNKINTTGIEFPPRTTYRGLSAASRDLAQCTSLDVGYDMNYGSSEESAKSIENIKRVEMPKKDPIFGEKGFLFDYWR
ncbi:hypothetical protein N9Q05_01055 [bacterium]|nr:hypothetical protein [bacterium]